MAKLPRQPEIPGQKRYLTEQAMAPRLRVFLIILALVGADSVWAVFHAKVIKQGFTLHKHLWGHPYIPGYMLGVYGAFFLTGLFMLWWMGFLHRMGMQQKKGVLATELGFLLLFVISSIVGFVHDGRKVLESSIQKEAFREGAKAAFVVVAIFMAIFALITNRMPRHWHNRFSGEGDGDDGSRPTGRWVQRPVYDGIDDFDELHEPSSV